MCKKKICFNHIEPNDEIENIEGIYSGKYQVRGGPFPLSKNEILCILELAKATFRSQETLLQISSPLALVGDIHGQYGDLMMIFQSLGHPPKTRYLFLGDYVDRGEHSLETILLLLSYTILYPLDVHILRGNHELYHINYFYGFMKECETKMSEEIYLKVNEVFDVFPLAAVIDKKVFCCHGGIGPHLKTLGQIQEIQRPLTESQVTPLVQDLLWADPSDDPSATGFRMNRLRGLSWMWSVSAAEQFLNANHLELIVRAHEPQINGVGVHSNGRGITIFSAPNYEEMDNFGAVMKLQKDLNYCFILFQRS